MDKRQAWVRFVKDAPGLNWRERAELRVAAFARWDEINDLMQEAAMEKGVVTDAVGAPTVDWLALLMELMPIIIKFFFKK